MIPEVGLFALILMLPTSLLVVWAGFFLSAPHTNFSSNDEVTPATRRKNAAFGSAFDNDSKENRYQALAVRGTYVMLILATFSFAMLMCAYALSDFTLTNVVDNSALHKPMLYKITGSWGNHEGSMLLWLLVLTGFSAAYARYGNAEKSTTLAVQALLIVGVALFVLTTSNPFARAFPAPLDGNGLNPVLQDVGLAIHPPVLYLGYVGFSLVFSLAIAALLQGRFGREEATTMRPWALIAWGFLTAGIGLGSWWAYRELGWGGWWFWDPVENASLLPWLSGTALVHLLIVTEKQGRFARWTLLLALLTFILSLLGTFLVRSGVLTSVHSFASDPARGVFILAFIALIAGAAFWLYARRPLSVVEAQSFSLLSRESQLMLQSLLLMTLCFTVALGTLYPLAAQLMGARSVSVGGEYFNTLGIPLLLPILAMAGFSPLLRWQGDQWGTLRPALFAALVATVLMVLLVFVLKLPRPWFSLLLLVPTAWLLAASAWDLWRRRSWKKSPRSFSVIVGHLGLVVLVLGMVGSGLWRLEIEKAVSVGESLTIGDFTLHYERFDARKEPDYQAFVAHLTVQRDGETIHHLQPEKRFYTVQQRPTSETSLVTVGVSELYAVVGEVDTLGRIGLRLYLTPLVFCLWLGFALVSMAGLMAGFARLRKPL